MRNRALAADMLAQVAMRRHDFATADAQARRSAQAGEDLVRFNPSDLLSWQYWIRGRDNVAQVLFERGDVSRSIDEQRATVALAHDGRRPASLDPMLADTWYDLAYAEADTEQRAAAERSLAAGTRASAEFAAQMAEDNPMRLLTLSRVPLARAQMLLILGEHSAAFEQASAGLRQADQLSFGEAANSANERRNNVLQWSLRLVGESALRLGRFAEAEAALRRGLSLPFYSFGDAADGRARRQVLLAHSLAQQGKGAEAQSVLAPALEHYRREKQAGATGTEFRLDYSEALYVHAIAQTDDAAGLRVRQQTLIEAGQSLAGASAEVRRLLGFREIAGWIDAARRAPGA